MRFGPFFHTDPIGLTFAADHQHTRTDPNLDAVWQLTLEPSKPLSLNTTLGLRVQALSLYPVFLSANQAYSEPGSFFTPPRVEDCLPNYALIAAHPIKEMGVRYEFWARESWEVVGRMTVTNHSDTLAEFGVQMLGELVLLASTEGFTPTKFQFDTYLKGTAGDLGVGFAIDSHARGLLSPLPGLWWHKALTAGESASFFWRICASPQQETLTKRVFAPYPENWDGEISRLLTSHQTRVIEMESARPDWDTAFYTLQNQAQQFLSTPNEDDSTPSVSPVRNIQLGLQNSTASTQKLHGLELWQICQMLLPTQPALCASLLDDLLATIPPSDSALVSALPFPVLCQLAWQIHQQLGEVAVIQPLVNTLTDLTLRWFNEAHDRDQDGLPEWSNSGQVGLHHIAAFNLLEMESAPTRVSSVESLGLAALLNAELDALQKLLSALQTPDQVDHIAQVKAKISTALAALQRDLPAAHWWDRDGHDQGEHVELYQGPLPHDGIVAVQLSKPARINLTIQFHGQLSRVERVVLGGTDAQEKPREDVLEKGEISWLPGLFYTASHSQFASLEKVTVDPAGFADLRLYTSDLTIKDVTGCLQTAKATVTEGDGLPRSCLGEEYRYGIPERCEPPLPIAESWVNLGWNGLVVESLLENDQPEAALALFEKLMAGQIGLLKREHSIFESFGSQDGRALGSRNHIQGLIPLQLFLRLAGVRILGPDRVMILGPNHIPWAFTLRFLGASVTRDGKNSRITLADGTEHHHFGSMPKTFRSTNQ